MNDRHQADIYKILRHDECKLAETRADADSALFALESPAGLVQVFMVLAPGTRHIEDVSYQYTLATPLPGGIDTFGGDMTLDDLQALGTLLAEIAATKKRVTRAYRQMAMTLARDGAMEGLDSEMLEAEVAADEIRATIRKRAGLRVRVAETPR